MTQEWFRTSFQEPTPAQVGAWTSISAGRDTLVVAPTGSGKTLAAFLWSLDRLATTPPPDDPLLACRVLYISPLKALAADVERNLRSPLVGMAHAATRLGLPAPEIRVSTRTGDTPAKDRAAFARKPGDVLITTPESLFLLLTSAARETLRGVEFVIIDEIHALAGTKRGAHLALSLERLDAHLPRPAQRIGLSATVRPIEEVSRFLAGGRPVDVVAPPSEKEWDLSVVVPVPDMESLDAPQRTGVAFGMTTALGPSPDDPWLTPAPGDAASTSPQPGPTPLPRSGPSAADLLPTPSVPPPQPSIWPYVEERVAQLISEHQSTIVFTNSRRGAERLTARLNEVAEQEDLDGAQLPDRGHGTLGPAEMIASSGQSHGSPPALARAHHGSVSKEQRFLIESDLKAGRLPAVVATSSLELGIDMGAVDLVIQVETPPSVASALQRVGRAGHQVGAVSRGIFFPKFRGDLLSSAVVLERMRAGAIEALSVPANPLDVLAQQIVAICAVDEISVGELLAMARRSAPFATLSRDILEAVLDMLAGRYPSEDFAELRPRIIWDRVTDVLTGRPGALRLAVTSGGTIPDRGLFLVMLAGDGAGRRVGELDEEMVYESRVGDVFTLGTTSWRIEEITHDRVLVSPAPGRSARLPFWKGESEGRPAELGRAVGAFVRELAAKPAAAARERLHAAGLDDWAADNLLAYLAEQRESTGVIPDDRTIVIERFRDEIGDWRVVIHSPFGGRVHAPWALCLRAALEERFGMDVAVMHADDGIVLRLPDMDEDGVDADLAAMVALDPDEVAELVTRHLGSSPLFAARFRECAARALLLPRRRPDKRQPLWQQRQRAAQLLQVATRYPDFPIVLETVRECLRDVFEVDELVSVLREIAAGRIRITTVTTPSSSPFARRLLFGYVAQFLYDGDLPLAERRAAALELDPRLLAELLGGDAGASLAQLLEPAVVAATEADLQRLSPERRARDAEGLWDVVRWLGPLSSADLAARSELPPAETDAAIAALASAHRLVEVTIAGEARWAVPEDVARLRDALGTPVPPGVPAMLLEPSETPLEDLVRRYARTHAIFRRGELAAWWGLPAAVVGPVLELLARQGALVHGELDPARVGTGAVDEPGPADDWCDAEILRLLRRRSLAALRAEVEPVSARDFARFLPQWHELADSATRPGPREGSASAPPAALPAATRVLRAVEQLTGARLPASSLESLILPARLPDYRPELLDAATTRGEVLWQGHAALPGDDGWMSLHLADSAPWTLHEPTDLDELEEGHRTLLEVMGAGGWFYPALAQAWACHGDTSGAASGQALPELLWDLLWAGYVTNDSLSPLRSLVSGTIRAARPRPSHRARPRWSGRAVALTRGAPRAETASVQGTGRLAGRWSRLPERDSDPNRRALITAEIMLDRHGIVTSAAAHAEELPGGFGGLYRTLAVAEEGGAVRRGYFVEGLGAAQFAGPGAVDRLRDVARRAEDGPPPGAEPVVQVLAAADPASPWGAELPWPDVTELGSHRPGRKAGSLVVQRDGELLAYLERGGRSLLVGRAGSARADDVAQALAGLVHGGALRSLSVEKVNGEPALRSTHPILAGLLAAGFHQSPKGVRLRA